MSAAQVTPISTPNAPIRFSRCAGGLSDQEFYRVLHLDSEIHRLTLELEEAKRERNKYPDQLVEVFEISQ